MTGEHQAPGEFAAFVLGKDRFIYEYPRRTSEHAGSYARLIIVRADVWVYMHVCVSARACVYVYTWQVAGQILFLLSLCIVMCQCCNQATYFVQI